MHPLLFHWIPLYFVMWACAAIVGLAVGTRVAAHAGFPAGRSAVAIMLLALSILVGSKLLYLAEAHWFPFDDYVPWEMRGAQHGFRIPGGMLALAAAMPLVCRALGLRWRSFGDTVIPLAALALVFIRAGCFLNGCCFGRVSSLPWAIAFPRQSWVFWYHRAEGWVLPTAHASLPVLNYGVSWGGTQDNGAVKGGAPLLWNQIVPGPGDSTRVVVDPTNSNVAYIAALNPSVFYKTTDGGKTLNPSMSPPPTPGTVAVDPTDHNTLVAQSGQDLYRTRDGAGSWTSLGTLGTGCNTTVIAPTSTAPSPIVLAGNCGMLKRTVNANGPGTPTWTIQGTGVFPSRCITSFACDQTVVCTATQGVMYTAFDGFEQNPNPNASTRHVFRSSDAGQTWVDVSGTGVTGLPDLPVNSIAVHPQDHNTIYAATDLGIFQGSYNPTTGVTAWGTLMNGLPPMVAIRKVAVHRDSGILRAFTYGRSAWEAKIFSVPNPDKKVNTTSPVNAQSPRISSGSGQPYAVAWVDDRSGDNNTHVWYQASGYDANGQPTPLAAAEFRVDDTFSTHAAQAVSLSADATSALPSLCSRLAWHDDRLSPGVYQHVYIGAMCSDGYKLFIHDIQADQNFTNINATNPSITFQPSRDFAVAWQTERGVGSALHDIYARFFNVFGNAKGGQFKVNLSAAPASTTTDASFPAVASDANNYVFVVWQESIINQTTSQMSDSRIVVEKYDANGNLQSLPRRVDSIDAAYDRYDAALAIDSSNNVIVSWWERKRDGTQAETVFRRRYTNALGSLESPMQVDNPPLVPPGVQRAARPSVATDASTNFLIAWQANVNAPDASSWSGFGKSFNSTAAVLKNDFRVDLHGRSLAGPTRAARTSLAGKFAFAWRDNRADGVHFDIYTRVVPSLQ